MSNNLTQPHAVHTRISSSVKSRASVNLSSAGQWPLRAVQPQGHARPHPLQSSLLTERAHTTRITCHQEAAHAVVAWAEVRGSFGGRQTAQLHRDGQARPHPAPALAHSGTVETTTKGDDHNIPCRPQVHGQTDKSFQPGYGRPVLPISKNSV
jgi:hypothetical protein